MMEVKSMLVKDRMQRKEYKGMWRWESKLTDEQVPKYSDQGHSQEQTKGQGLQLQFQITLEA